ncbi:UDP-glucuronosyltransferase 2B31-like [Peromyscus californicus insignis]|uniref:UDP-glucuronosyltransferase 2B31-like n=1 Tax=Peromyscus californicus insignis TaxID=564181 RepID=UPI0022A7A999|nr:UDP-glucuronosyltransferase 2B31-like [Peromyscus californicus insignis]
MSVKMTAALLLLQLSRFFGSGSGGKVLVWPMEYSHWLNLKVILEELVKKGHEVTVLIPSVSFTYKVDEASAIEFEIYPSSFPKADLEELYIELFRKCIYELPKQSFWRYFLMLQELVWKYSDYFESLCKDVVFNKELMTKLHNSSFDVIVADPFIPCSDLLAEILKIPLVYSLCFFPGSTYEKYSGGLPLPPSYVPPAMSELSDQMTIMERVQNVIYVLCFDFCFQNFNEKRWNQLYSEVLGRPTTLTEMMGKADIWLIRTYWDLEFPHPLLPNFDYVGGLHCRPAKPLPKGTGIETQLQAGWIPIFPGPRPEPVKLPRGPARSLRPCFCLPSAQDSLLHRTFVLTPRTASCCTGVPIFAAHSGATLPSYFRGSHCRAPGQHRSG